jgi:18S rRNA (adenine1779-N6/adenine1780-N6)-dimethyltransferase
MSWRWKWTVGWSAGVLKRVEHTDLSHKLKSFRRRHSYQWPFLISWCNLPYQISSSVVFKLLSHPPCFAVPSYVSGRICSSLTARPGLVLSIVGQYPVTRQGRSTPGWRNNFRPPPGGITRGAVEQSPPPPVNFTEWDGMVRFVYGIYVSCRMFSLLSCFYVC